MKITGEIAAEMTGKIADEIADEFTDELAGNYGRALYSSHLATPSSSQ